MRARLPALAALVALALVAPGPTIRAAMAQAPAGPRDLVVVNRSPLEISELYVSPTTSDAWGEDRLGEATLAPGRSLRLRLGRQRDCAFDVLAIYADASREERAAHDLCRTRNVALDGSTRIHPVAERREIVLSNQSGRPIQQVFVSAANATAWGEDLLARAISVGEHAAIAWRGPCIVDIRIVFENRAAEERRDADLCRRAALSIEPGWTTSDDLPAPPA
jgi:hypothetical protein